MNEIARWFILIILIFLSGFFSSCETALMALNKIKVRHLAEKRVKGAQTVLELTNNPNQLLGVILVGNNIVNISASALATYMAIGYFGDTGVGIATSVMTILILIFGEITPKSLAIKHSHKIALLVAPFILFITKILGPLVYVLTSFTNILIGGKGKNNQPFITEDEFKTMVQVSHEEGVLEGEERKMIDNVFEFGDSQVEEVMTPRTDMAAIEIQSTYAEIIEIFKTTQFSRIPVYKELIDDIVGILYIKDIIFFDKEREAFNITEFIRQPFFTYEFKKTTEVFDEMRKSRMPVAIVLDEYGGTSGIVTMEDLVEEIVGEIEDEYDEEKSDIKIINDHEYMVDGSSKIDLVNEVVGIQIYSEQFDSIGGFILGELNRLPNNGEIFKYNNIKFIIEKVHKNRIVKLKIVL